jgi:phosphoglycolate phosphatase-like HAD superfamily hydrolase
MLPAYCYHWKMVFRVLISDLDGTLLDTLQDMADAVNIALGRLGLPGHELSEYRYFVGDGRRAMATRALPADHRDDVVLEALLAHIAEEYDKRWMDHSIPYRGIPELLDALSAGGHSHVGVVQQTSGIRRAYGIQDAFALVIRVRGRRVACVAAKARPGRCASDY